MIQLHTSPTVRTRDAEDDVDWGAYAMPMPSSALPLNRTKRIRFAILMTVRYTVRSCTTVFSLGTHGIPYKATTDQSSSDE